MLSVYDYIVKKHIGYISAMIQNFNGYLLALLAIFFWSFNVIYSKYLAGVFTPFEISFIRWAIPAVLFLPFAYKDIISYRKKILDNWLIILILTLTGLGFQNTFIYYAGHTANAVDMALIGATSPVFLMIFSAIFLHKRISFYQILGIIIALLGVVVIIFKTDNGIGKHVNLSVGDVWMFISAITFAIYGVVQKKFPANLPQFPFFTFMICLSTLMFLPLAAYDFGYSEPEHIRKVDVVILIILGVFNSGIAYIAWNKAIAKIGTVKSGMIYYLIPVFSTIEAYWLLDEKITAEQIYGIILVLTGIMISNYNKKTLQPMKNSEHVVQQQWTSYKKKRRKRISL